MTQFIVGETVECIDDSECEETLLVGNEYEVLDVDYVEVRSDSILIKDDNRDEDWFFAFRFQSIRPKEVSESEVKAGFWLSMDNELEKRK